MTIVNYDGKLLEAYYLGAHSQEEKMPETTVKEEDTLVNKEEKEPFSIAPKNEKELQKAVDDFFNSNKGFKLFSFAKSLIEDVVPKDFVEMENLVNGRIYKYTPFNMVVRYKGLEKDLIKLEHHGIVFYLGQQPLIKASENEVSNYLDLE